MRIARELVKHRIQNNGKAEQQNSLINTFHNRNLLVLLQLTNIISLCENTGKFTYSVLKRLAYFVVPLFRILCFTYSHNIKTATHLLLSIL